MRSVACFRAWLAYVTTVFVAPLAVTALLAGALPGAPAVASSGVAHTARDASGLHDARSPLSTGGTREVRSMSGSGMSEHLDAAPSVRVPALPGQHSERVEDGAGTALSHAVRRLRHGRAPPA